MDKFVLIIVFLDAVYISDAVITSWNMHHTCGQTLSQSDRGGFLILNSDLLPAGHQNDCRVVIQPESTKSSTTSGYHVLFHFSDFEVGRHCQDTNVTVLDGNGINMNPIEGLKSPMCGSNTSLTKDVTFTTQSYFITVLFQRNAAGMNFKSKFNLTFLSFSEGSCGSGDKTLFSCTNKRCIDEKFTCQNINPCGDNSDCPTTTLADNLENVVEAVKYVVFVIFVIVMLGIFYKVWKKTCMRSSRSRCCCNLEDYPCPDCSCHFCKRCLCDCTVCRNCWSGLVARCSSCKRGLVTRCSGCRDSCSEIECSNFRNCCLVARIVMLYRRVKARLTSSGEAEENRVNSEGTQEPGQVTSQDTQERAVSDISHNRSDSNTHGASRNYRNEAYDSDEDSYVSDFDSINSDGDAGRPTDAPPSYQEAAAAPRPLLAVPTAPSSSLDTTAPPTYDEAVANMTKYTKRK